jgi:hypothetical protein
MFEPNHNSGWVRTSQQCAKFGTQIFYEDGCMENVMECFIINLESSDENAEEKSDPP